MSLTPDALAMLHALIAADGDASRAARLLGWHAVDGVMPGLDRYVAAADELERAGMVVPIGTRTYRVTDAGRAVPAMHHAAPHQ